MTGTQAGWFQGLVAALISGGCDFAVGAAILPGHLKAVLLLAAISSLKNGAAYLAKSPLPGLKGDCSHV